MLTRLHAELIAHRLVEAYGEAALAAAVWRTQEAALAGETSKLTDWEQITLATERVGAH